MGVPDIYTKSLLHMDGANASTTFTDESGKTWIALNNAQIDIAQSVFGGASGLFDGTGDYIRTAASLDWANGTKSWTFDFRIRFNALPTNGVTQIVWGQREYPSANKINQICFLNTSGVYSFYLQSYTGSWTKPIDENITIAVNTWYHFEMARNGSSWYIFQDGTQIGSTTTDSISLSDPNAVATIGEAEESGSPMGVAINGWMDEFRYSEGIARHTANFIPPTHAYGQLPKINTINGVPMTNIKTLCGKPIDDLKTLQGIT